MLAAFAVAVAVGLLLFGLLKIFHVERKDDDDGE